MEIVTGHRGTPHVTPYKVRDFNIGIVGAEDYVMNGGSELEAQLVSNNRIDIKDGSICMQGTHAVIPKNINDELTIENGMQGEKRIDLIVARYEKVADSGVESVNTVVLQGTPSKESPIVPGHVVGDIRNGDLKHEMPLYEVELDGINVIEVRPVFKKIVSAAEQQKMIELLNGNIIVDMKEDEFLTNETYLGQPVYGKYIDIKKIAIQSYIPLNIPDSFFWIDTGNSYVYPISQNLDTMYPFPYVNPQDTASSIRYALSKKNKSIMLFGGDWTGYGLYLLVKYYKY